MSVAEDRKAPERSTKASSKRIAAHKNLTPWLVSLVWLVGTALLSMQAIERGGLELDGEYQGLLPEPQRAGTGEPWLLLRAQQEPDPDPMLGEEPGEAVRGNLLAAALAIAQAIPDERSSLAPPANAVTAWLDSHGLYLLRVERHADLAQRLDDERVSAAVQGLMARLSSPAFGVSGEQARRDPLGLRPVLARDSGMLGHVQVADASAPTVTGAGDLLGADGRALVIQLRSQRPLAEIVEDARKAVADLPVSIVALGPDAHRDAVLEQTTARQPQLLTTLAAALILVLALALRRARPVICLVLCLGSGLLLIDLLSPAFDPLSLPLAICLPAFACGAALRLQRISTAGWAGSVLIATALLPLWLSPYPEWADWSVHWLIAAAALIVLVRVLMPALLRVVRGSVEWRSPGFMLAPMPALGLLLLAGLTGAGAWASNTLRYAGADAVAVSDEAHADAEEALREQFFDPKQLVEARTPGPTPAQALERAAIEAESLAGLVGAEAVRLDSPGSYVIPTAQLEERMKSLSSFELPRRMQNLHDTLEAQGLRADAFTEFLHGAADIESIPTAQAALDDALGTWMGRYVIEQPEASEEERWVVRSFLQLRPKTAAPSVTTDDGVDIELRGPAIAVRRDANSFRNRVGIYVASGLWLGAFLVWLGTGSLAVAISSAFAGLATESAVLVVMALSRQSFGPSLLPVLLLVGVAGMVAAGRACRAVDLRRPLVAAGMLTAGICQIGAGVALLASPEPLWRQMGLVLTSGSAVAVGLGLFAAPGICLLLRRVAGKRSESDADEEDGG